jgi:hypothetical protein
MESNNTNKILPENTMPDKKGRAWKVLLLGTISAGLFIINWWLVETALYDERPLTFWGWPALTSALAIIFLTFFSLVNYNRWYAAFFTLASLLSYVYLFPKNIYVFLGGLFFLLLTIWFEQRIRSEETSRQDFSIRRVSSASINVMVYAILLLLGMNIYYNTSADFKANPDSFYESLGKSAANSAKYISGEDRSGIDFNQSLDQYLEAEAKQEYSNYDSLPQSQKDRVISEAKDEFFRQFNVEISSDRSLSEIMAQAAVDRIRQSARGFEQLFPLIFTLIIVALMRTFSFVFRWLTLAATWVFFRILLSLKFFRLTRVPVEVQKLDI